MYSEQHIMCTSIPVYIIFSVSPSNQDPVTLSEDHANGQDIRSSYELAYISSSGTSVTTCTCFVNGTDCSNDVCQHNLRNNTADSRCDPPLHQFSGENVTVTVAAKNIVGKSNPAVSRDISELLMTLL